MINTNFGYPKMGPSWNTETPPAILSFTKSSSGTSMRLPCLVILYYVFKFEKLYIYIKTFVPPLELCSVNISSVVEFQRCWVLKSKLFGQESTFSKETLKKISFYELRFIKKCQNSKGKIVSKRFFLAKDSSKKRTKTRHILVKPN